jgi:hypothetical protein
MQPKSSLPWDLEKAMTTLTVSADGYKEYWMKSQPDDVCRRPDGSIDFDFYRERARRERILATKEVCGELFAVMIRLFRLIGSTLRRETASTAQSACRPQSHSIFG